MCSFLCRSVIRMSIRFAVCSILVYSRLFIYHGEFFCLSNYVDVLIEGFSSFTFHRFAFSYVREHD